MCIENPFKNVKDFGFRAHPVILTQLLSVQCYAMHGQNVNLRVCVCVCVCVRHTFCQLAYRSDPLTDFYS